MKINFLTIFLALFLVILCCALAGVGYWAFTLNTNLKATQGELATLQGKYDSLTVEKNKLSSDLDQATAELEATKTELSTTKSDLTKSKSETAALQAKIDKAMKFVEVMTGIWSDNDTFAETLIKVKATNDATHLSLYEKYMNNSNSSTDFNNWFEYFFEAMADILK